MIGIKLKPDTPVNVTGLLKLDNLDEVNRFTFVSIGYHCPQSRLKVVILPELNAVQIKEGCTDIAYATKINGQRWGVKVSVDLKSGVFLLSTDIDSPIVHVTFKLTR